MTLKTQNILSRVLLTGIFICIFGISAVGALGINYVGLDNVDLTLDKISNEDFIKYQINRDGNLIATIFDPSGTTYRDDGVSEGTHDYTITIVSTEGSGEVFAQTVYVGEPYGQLTFGDDTWTDANVQLGGDVDLGGYELTIIGCQVTAGSEYEIAGSGKLTIQDSTFSGVTVDATAPYAQIEKVTSDRPITVKGGNINATEVEIPWGNTWGPGDHVIYLYGDHNTITKCNAEARIQGDFGAIVNCEGEYVKIRAVGDNATIQENIIRDVRGHGIYASGNDLKIYSNQIRNATRWEKSQYWIEAGAGIYLHDCCKNVDIFENTIEEASDNGIYACINENDGPMTNYTFSFNIIRDCYGIGLRNWGKCSDWKMEDNTFGTSDHWMVYINQADRLHIQENTFSNMASGGLYIGAANSTVTQNTLTVEDNIAMEVGTTDGKGNITVSHNTITGAPFDDDCCPDGISFSAQDSVLEDNIITNCRNAMETSYKENMTVRDNQVLDCWGEWGLYFYDSYRGLVENNTLINSSASDSTAKGAIYVHNTGNATVRNNLIDGGRFGISVEFADDGLVIEQNTIKNTTSCAVKVYMAKNGDGYHNYRGPANVTTRDNTIISNGYAGYGCYYVYGTSFVNNTVTGLSRGVLLSVANNSVIRDNRFDDIEQGFSIISAPHSSVEKNTFNVTNIGGIIDTGSDSQNITDNRITGYDTTGIQVNEPEGTVLSNNTLCRKDNAWDIYLDIPQEEFQYSLVLEENTVGVEHPTTFTITELNNPIFIRGVENPPEPPSPPDYETTKNAIGNWIEIIGQMGLKKVRMNLSFHYTDEEIIGVEEKTLSIWKHNGTRWDPGSEDWDTAWNSTRWHDTANNEIGVEVEELCIFAPLGGYPVHNTRIPEDYTTITEALNDFNFQSGDTITVDEGYSGTKENILIGDSMILKSSSGTPAAVTLTAEDPYEPTVKVYADDVEIDGFVITGATGTQGIRFAGADNAKVTNSRIEGNFFGVSICRDSWGEASSYGKVTDCTITGNEHGAVVINESAECLVTDCTLSGDVGIGILDSESTYVSGNTITNCNDYGIAVDGGRDNEVTDCTMTGGGIGIYLYGGESQTVTDCTVTDTNAPGVLLEETEGNTLTGNSVTGAPLGIGCEGSDDNTFTNNQIKGGDAGGSHLLGIALDSSDGNTFTGCSVEDLHVVGYATTGIEMTGTSHTNTIDSCRFSGFDSSRVDGAVFASSGNLLRNCTFTDMRGATSGVAGISTTQNTTGNIVRHCSFDGIYAPENATAFEIRDTKDLLITDCTVGTITPANTSVFAIFENSDYSNVIEETTLGTLSDMRELHADGNLTVANTNIIPADDDDVVNIGHYLNVTSDDSGEAWVSFAYTDDDLGGKNPALLSVWRHDGANWQKLPAPNGVNTDEKYVYADNITSFSVIAPMWSGSGLPKANFTAAPTDGTAPLEVTFTDTSRNAESWVWTFGDGVTATTQSPVHTYTTIGSFNVTLTVVNAIGSDAMTKTSFITVRDAPPGPSEGEEDYATNNTGTTVTDIGNRQQVSFNTTAGNGTVSGDDIILNNGQLNVTIQTDGLTSVGNTSTGNVTGVQLESAPLNASVGSGVGNVSVNFNASMDAYNPDLGITTGIYDRPSDAAATAFTLAAADEGLSITDTAYAVYFTKTNMTDGNGIKNATLQMTVSPDWVNANGGTDAIRVFRQADGGETEILDTTYLGTNTEGMMVFAAFSPDGFSSFAVAATSLAPTPTPTPTPAPVPDDDGDDTGGDFSAATAGALHAGDTATLAVENSPVTRITVDMDADAPGLLVTVSDQAQRPDGIPAPEGDVWEYLSFTLYRADPSAIGDAVITFSVPSDILAGRMPVLWHYTGEEWVALPTSPAGTDGSNRLFTAMTPGFSWFAVGITDESLPPAGPAAETPTPAAPSPTAAPVPVAPGPAVTPLSTPAASTTSTPAQETPLSVAGVLFGAAGAAFLYPKRR